MATTWPCDNAIDCPCADSNPAQNYSSEAPDPFTFFARRFFPNPIDLADPNQVYIATSCGQTCTSAISQADADACALRAAVQCVQPPGPPAPDDPVLFGNRATSCQAACPEGPPFILSIPAGTYLARTQELADLIAQSFCQADVLQFRHCDMPPMPPPQGVCPHITTQTTSPINANDGDNVTMTVNYTYNSAMMLMFVWFKDGVPTYATPSSTLTLNAVGPSDEGQYILGIYASGCFPVFSSPIVLNVTSACPPEVGPDAPMTLDIEHPVEWETYTINNVDLSPLVSADGFCNPTGLFVVSPTSLDHSPGNYGFRYVAGVLSRPSQDINCGGGQFWFEPPGNARLDIVNDEYNFDMPGACFDTVITGGISGAYRSMAGDPPPGAQLPAVSTCHGSALDAETFFEAYFAGSVHIQAAYPPNQIDVFPHTNTGGLFKVYVSDYGDTIPQVIVTPYEVKVLQIEGQIAQPRKLQIDNFGVVSGDFSNPAIGANWDGSFPVRTTYTSAALLWSAASSGGFGGATIEWVANHPTSANGFGWRLKVYGAGPTLVYQAVKGIDADSLGLYYKEATATPIGPDCVNISDASTTDWFPTP